MLEKLNEAYEELKRVEHLIYVSLKYTRTVDVIINILTRMTDGYALMVDALIMYAQEQGKISFEPESAVERATLIKQVFSNDDIVVDNMELYLLLRKLLRAKNVERENEYRRYVTMKTIIDGREEIVTIDIITNYCLYQRDFLSHVRTIIEGKSSVETVMQSEQQPQEPSWMKNNKEEEESLEDLEKTNRQVSLPLSKQPMKVRPVTAPPRKRAPRPKKYKIQIPKGKNPFMTPEYMPAIRAAMDAEKAKQAASAKPKAKPIKAAKAAKKQSKPAPKSKPKKTPAKPKKQPKSASKKKR